MMQAFEQKDQGIMMQAFEKKDQGITPLTGDPAQWLLWITATSAYLKGSSPWMARTLHQGSKLNVDTEQDLSIYITDQDPSTKTALIHTATRNRNELKAAEIAAIATIARCVESLSEVSDDDDFQRACTDRDVPGA
jgi:hypothetical protein